SWSKIVIPAAVASILATAMPAGAQVANWDTSARDQAEIRVSQAVNHLSKWSKAKRQANQRGLDDVDEAIRLLTEAVHLDATDAAALALLGVALDIKGRYQEGLDALTEAYKIAPKQAETTLDIGLTHYLARNYDKALAIWKRLLNFDPRL